MVSQAFHLLLHRNTDIYLAGFIFFASLCSYSFHWWLSHVPASGSDRVEWLRKNKLVHLALFIVGTAGTAIFGWYMIPYWPWIMIAAIATFFYSAPKIPHPHAKLLLRIAIGKTLFLAFVWVYVTTLLPIVVAGEAWQPAFTWFTLSRFFFVFAICILFDNRDRHEDKAAGIRSLVILFDQRGVKTMFFISLALFAGCTLLLLWENFSVYQVIILLIPGIITSLLFKRATQRPTDMLYYFVLDLLMAGSAIVMICVRLFNM